MQHHGEITIRFTIPPGQDGEPDLALGYEAIAKTEKMAKAIVKELHEMGVAGAEQRRRIFAHEAVHSGVVPAKRAAE